MCHVANVLFLFYLFFIYKVVELVGGGSVINGVYPVLFFVCLFSFILQARRKAAEEEVVTDEEEVEGEEEGEKKFYDVCKLENEKK